MKRIWDCLIWKFNSTIMLCFAIIIAHTIWGKFARVPINYLQCIVQIVFVLVIYIWKYGMERLKDSFQNMRGLFKTADYNSVYQKFIDKLLWTGFETNNKRLIISAVKHFAVWIFVWIYLLYQLFRYKLFSFDLGGMTSAFLLYASAI